MDSPVSVADIPKKKIITKKSLFIVLLGIFLISISVLAYLILSPVKVSISNQSKHYQLAFKSSVEFRKFLESLKFTKNIDIMVTDVSVNQEGAESQAINVKIGEQSDNTRDIKIEVLINNRKTTLFTEKELSNIISVQLISIIYSTTPAKGSATQHIENVNNFNDIFVRTNTQPFSLMEK